MISEYIQAALRRANYEREDTVFYADVSELPGVLASGNTLEECRKELIDVIEGWLIVGIRHSDFLPVFDGIDLNISIDSNKLAASGYVSPVEEIPCGNVSGVVDADIKTSPKGRMYITVNGLRFNLTVKKDSYKLYILVFKVKIGGAEAGTKILVTK